MPFHLSYWTVSPNIAKVSPFTLGSSAHCFNPLCIHFNDQIAHNVSSYPFSHGFGIIQLSLPSDIPYTNINNWTKSEIRIKLRKRKENKAQKTTTQKYKNKLKWTEYDTKSTRYNSRKYITHIGTRTIAKRFSFLTSLYLFNVECSMLSVGLVFIQYLCACVYLPKSIERIMKE